MNASSLIIDKMAFILSRSASGLMGSPYLPKPSCSMLLKLNTLSNFKLDFASWSTVIV
eukprot:CAMPEP_0197541940 /NCGR_PEP_ID=MMETSP1318-20131121/67436_1 /TAXON_ID=552666 /ORGANISM="Partenskyella glossopodia, Strain RCC365" /LENGTH=57 /DNA_ID=CAMNT_0043101165 /DNA_START=430 /DNA_END=603 /DNA_ORIENTATION=-